MCRSFGLMVIRAYRALEPSLSVHVGIQLPGNSQVDMAHYKGDCLPLPLSLSYPCFSPLPLAPLLPFSPHSFTPSLYVVMASLYFSTLSFSLPFSASTILLTPFPMA